MAPSSIYGSRASTASLASARSRATVTHSLPGSRKLKPKWWQKRPIIKSAIFTDLQKGSYAAAIFTLVSRVFNGSEQEEANVLIKKRLNTRTSCYPNARQDCAWCVIGDQ